MAALRQAQVPVRPRGPAWPLLVFALARGRPATPGFGGTRFLGQHTERTCAPLARGYALGKRLGQPKRQQVDVRQRGGLCADPFKLLTTLLKYLLKIDLRHRFPDFNAAAAALRGWETRYNYERFSLALKGRTPAEKLAALHPPERVA